MYEIFENLIKGGFCAKIPPKNSAKGIYAFGIMIGTALAIILKVRGGEWIYSKLYPSPEISQECWEMLAVYRTALSLILYHFCLASTLIKLGDVEDDFRWMIHFQIWPIKALVWLGTLVGMFWITNDAMIKFWIPSCKIRLES